MYNNVYFVLLIVGHMMYLVTIFVNVKNLGTFFYICICLSYLILYVKVGITSMPYKY